MNLIDTHTHLHFKDFDKDRKEIVERAHKTGVSQIVTLGTDVGSSQKTLEIAGEFKGIYAAVGIHPSEAHTVLPQDFSIIAKLAQKENKVVAIGEIGLDFYWEKKHYQAQYNVFGKMLNIAKKLELPVVIHNRSAQREMEWYFQEKGFSEVNGVMHCFAGEVIDARFYLDMGLHISFTANITHKNFQGFKVIQYVPLDRLMIETDSPFIPPIQYQKQRNEPAYVIHVAEKLAEVHGISLEEIARITTENATRFFKLPVD